MKRFATSRNGRSITFAAFPSSADFTVASTASTLARLMWGVFESMLTRSFSPETGGLSPLTLDLLDHLDDRHRELGLTLVSGAHFLERSHFGLRKNAALLTVPLMNEAK